MIKCKVINRKQLCSTVYSNLLPAKHLFLEGNFHLRYKQDLNTRLTQFSEGISIPDYLIWYSAHDDFIG